MLSETQQQNRQQRKILSEDRFSTKFSHQISVTNKHLIENFLTKLEGELYISVDSPIAVRESLAKFVEELLEKESFQVKQEGNKNDPKFKDE